MLPKNTGQRSGKPRYVTGNKLMGIIDGDTKEENPPRNDSGAGFQILPTRHLASLKSVQLLWQKLAADALVVALNGGSLLALALSSGFFVELASTQFGQQTGFLDRALEATQRGFKGLVFFQTNDRHRMLDVKMTTVKQQNSLSS